MSQSPSTPEAAEPLSAAPVRSLGHAFDWFLGRTAASDGVAATLAGPGFAPQEPDLAIEEARSAKYG